MITIRANSGLGDAIYLQSVARHFVLQGETVEVCSDWPDVFRCLDVTVAPFRRHPVTHCAAYTMRKAIAKTTQFQDCCLQAGIRAEVELRLDWKPSNEHLVRRIRAMSPAVMVLLPRKPMNRTDGFGDELLPEGVVVQSAIDLLRARGVSIVQVGSGDALYRFSGIDLDLSNRTTVCELIDAAWACDGALGYCSFMVPLSESLGKPALFVWSRRGLTSQRDFIAQITPKKILHNASSASIIDDCCDHTLARSVGRLRSEIGSQAKAGQQASGDCRVCA